LEKLLDSGNINEHNSKKLATTATGINDINEESMNEDSNLADQICNGDFSPMRQCHNQQCKKPTKPNNRIACCHPQCSVTRRNTPSATFTTIPMKPNMTDPNPKDWVLKHQAKQLFKRNAWLRRCNIKTNDDRSNIRICDIRKYHLRVAVWNEYLRRIGCRSDTRTEIRICNKHGQETMTLPFSWTPQNGETKYESEEITVPSAFASKSEHECV
jgi:hypothetical protein